MGAIGALKRKEPGALPLQETPRQQINVLSDVVVTSAVAPPQVSGAAVVNSCSGNQQVVDLGPLHSLSPSVLQLSDCDFETLNPEVMGIIEELERTAKCPKLDMPPLCSQTTCETEASMSNLEQKDEGNTFKFSIPTVPPLLSPLPNDDDDNIEQIKKNSRPSSSSSSSSSSRTPARNSQKRVRFKLPAPCKNNEKDGGDKKTAPLLRAALEDRAGRSKNEKQSKKDYKNYSYNSEFDCFSQSEERDVIAKAAKIYKTAKEVVVREQKIIEETVAEIEKIREKLTLLEKKLDKHRSVLDKASKKIKTVEAIFK